jgi:hypothetical protein
MNRDAYLSRNAEELALAMSEYGRFLCYESAPFGLTKARAISFNTKVVRDGVGYLSLNTYAAYRLFFFYLRMGKNENYISEKITQIK